METSKAETNVHASRILERETAPDEERDFPDQKFLQGLLLAVILGLLSWAAIFRVFG